MAQLLIAVWPTISGFSSLSLGRLTSLETARASLSCQKAGREGFGNMSYRRVLSFIGTDTAQPMGVCRPWGGWLSSTEQQGGRRKRLCRQLWCQVQPRNQVTPSSPGARDGPHSKTTSSPIAGCNRILRGEVHLPATDQTTAQNAELPQLGHIQL